MAIFLLSSRAHTNVDEGAKENKHDPKDQEDQIPPLHIGKFPANLIWSGRGRRDGWQIAVLANYCACVLGMAVPTKDIPYLGGYI